MERQSTSKLFKIVIAIVAFFVLCSSALLFASCGVSKDDGHEHVYPETPNATVPATCGTPGYIVYECTECGEQFKVEISLATGKHTFNENDVCKNCGMTKTQADLLTQAAFKSAIDDLKNTLGTLATGAQLQGLNDLSQAQVKTLTDALETALKAAITNAQTAITDAVGGTGSDSAKTAILQAIQDALEDINGKDPTSVQSVLKAEIEKQTAKIEEYNTKLEGLKTSLEAAQGEAKDAIIEEINKTNEAIESAKDAIVAAVSVAQTSIEGKLDDLDEKVGTAQTTLSGEIGNVKTVVDGIQEALKALNDLAKTTDVKEVKTLVEEFQRTLTATLTEKFGSIDSAIKALTDAQTGIAASVNKNTDAKLEALKGELVTLITTETSDDKFNAVVSEITQEITDAFNSFKSTLETTLDDRLAGILTQSHFDTELQKVTATLGEIKTKVNENLDKKLSEVETSIGTAQTAILAAIEKMAGSEQEGEGPVLPTIKGWVQEILYAITGDSQYAPAAGASLMSEPVRPEGMQKQIADLWDKADELQDALATLSGSLTTLSDSVSNLPNKDEVQGYFAQLKKDLEDEQATYASNLTTLNSTLSSVSTKVDNVQSYLEETLYVKLGQMDDKLTTLVQNMGEFYTLFTKLRTYAQEHYADLGGKTWEEVFDNVLNTYGAYFQQLPDYLGKLKGWDDIIDSIIEFAKKEGIVNEAGGLEVGNFTKAVDTLKYVYDFLGVGDALEGGRYAQKTVTTLAGLVDLLNTINGNTDELEGMVRDLAGKFKDIDNETLKAALNALTGDKDTEGSLNQLADLLGQLPDNTEIKQLFVEALGAGDGNYDLVGKLGALIDDKFTEYKDRYQSYIDLAKEYIKIANQLKGIFDHYGIENLQKLVEWAFGERQNLKALVEAGTNLKALASNQQAIVDAATKWNEFLQSQDLADIIAAAGAINDKDTGIKALAGLIGKLDGDVQGLPNSEAIVNAFKAALADLTIESKVDTSEVVKDLKEEIKTLLNMVLPEEYQNNWAGLASLAQNFVELVIDLKESIFTGEHGVEQLARLADWAFDNRGKINALVANADEFVDLVDGETGVLAQLEKVFGDNGFGKVDELSNKLGGFTAENTLKNYLDKVFGGYSEAGAHQHNWVMRPAKEVGSEVGSNVYEPASASDNIKLDCLAEKHYVWLCTICGEYQKVNGDYVVETVAPTGHVTDWTHFDAETPTFGEGDEPETTYYAPTCVNPGRVEGYCVVCGQPTGEWTTVGAPTGIHNYVLEDGTDAEGNPGTQHTCTSIHKNVYHCTTCGGAYVEEVTVEGFDPDTSNHGNFTTPHNYYTLSFDEQNDLFDAYVKQYNKDHSDKPITVEDLTAQQKYELLEPYLNKVWDSPATCVEPALTVVECVECHVRYAYANGTPKGHDFELHLGQDATCTMDGNKSYAFCPDCGYYFEIPETVKVSTLSFTAPTLSEGKYHYDGEEITEGLAKWLNDNAYSKDYAPKGGTAFKGADNEAAHAYFANGKEAKGHTYVVVYTNIPNCVTAPTYMLVCETCFKVGDKSFKDLVEVEGTPNPDALFYQEAAEEGVVGKYWVKDLSGSETGGIDADADAEKVGAIIGEADPADSDLAKQVAKYVKDAEDANADANVKAEAKAKLVEWILKYGVRDGGNKWTAEELSAMDVAALKDLIDTEIGENYKSNVVKDASFVLPVKGHTFNDVVTTVVGVCVMYPRHQFFCSVCGQDAVDPSFTTSAGDTEVPKLGNAKVPYFVTGKADAAMAYTVPEEKVTDLEKDWNKVYKEGKGDLDEILKWLGKYGYLNDFRESIATPWNETELTTVKANLGKHYGTDSEELADVSVANIYTWGLFTGKNVLNEYIDNKDEKGDVKPIGHTFNLAIQLDAGSCNEPGAYVYVCSVCGMKSAWEFGDKSNHSAIKQPSWWVGAEEPDTYIEYEMGDATVKTNVRLLEAHDKNEQWGPSWNYYYLFDSALDGSNGQMNANIPTGRTDIDKSDLVKSWEAAQAGTENGDAIFEWLLEHGYLNNVIDTVIEMARADLADANNYNITQQAAGEAAWENYYEYTAQNIYDLAYAWWKGTETITLVDEGEPVNVLDTMAKIFNATGETEIEANDLQLDEEKQKAILQLVLVGGPVENTQDGTVEGILGEDADLSVFYTKQGSGQEYGYAAQTSNSTYVGAATPIPVSGHVYLKGDGYRYDKHNDPRCKDFASDELTEHYKNNELVYWVSEATEKEPHKGHWEVCGTFNPNNLDPTFKAQADEFGILAACKRQNCPFHAEYNAEQYGEGKEQYTAGYVAAEPHNMVMEKWAADSETGYPLRADQAGKFEGSVEKTRVQYKRGYESYLGLAEDGRKIVTEVKDVNGEVKATAEQIAAAQAKMDKDLYNLNTLQAIWNGLFIGDEYINSHKLESGELPYYGKVFTLEDLKENGVITEATLAALAKALNDEEIPLLWNEDHGKIVSAWRPLNDEGAPSCWIINRCEWYQYERKDVEGEFVENYNGTMCTMSLGNNAHDWPYEGEFDFETHTANCQHVDLCNTCGEPIGTKGDHKLRRVSSDEDNALLDPALQDAWLAILNHLKFDEPDENLAWLKGLVEMEDKDKSGKIDKWDEWTVLGDTCYKHVDDDEGKTEGEENGHEIYICIGELEVIYETVKTLDKSFETVYTADNASGKPIAWLLAEEKDIKVDGSCANANYFVKTIDEIPHEYVTRYYSDEACTQVILNKDGEPATTLVEVGSSDKQYVCQVGFWEEKCCINEKRDGEPCDCREPDSKIYHAPIGHVVAPIKNYDSREYQDADKYSPATEARNAVIDQVCVYCGSTFHTEWTKAKPEDGSDRDMYKLASPAEMDAWNEYNTNDSNDVEPFKPKDWKTEPGKTGNVSAYAWNHNANYTYKEDANLTLEAGKNEFKIGANLNPQVTIGKDATLTLKGTENDVGLTIWGAKLTVKGEDKNTSVLDLSELGKGDHLAIVIEQVGSELTLENLTVKLGSTPNSVIFPMGDDIYGGSKVIVKDCIIVKEGGGAPIQTSQVKSGMCSNVEIVITDSVIISKDDTALFINEETAKVTAKNSKFFGKNMGVVIRGGNAKFTNCTFATEAGQSYSGGSWSDGTNIPVSAGIVVGTKNPVAAYGNANVKLNGCTFQLGTYSDFATENKIQTVAMTPEFSGTDYSIALFGNETNHATLTLDAATAIVAQNMYKDAASGDNATLNVPDATKEDLGATPEIQAQNAAKLVENLVAAGGSVTLPKIDEEIAVKGAFGVDQPGFFNTAKDAVTDIDLGGNTLAVDGNGSMIKGTLTLKNGTLQTPQEGGAQVTFAVEGKLELVDMHMTFDNGSILPVGENAEISITGGVFIGKSVYATLINTNNVDTKPCTITLKKAVFISELSSAVLINTENVTLTAEDCQFFGIDTAVWVRAGNATFTNCTFISGGWRVAQDAWGEGTKMSRQAYAALAVGEGVGTTYGKAIVTVNGESTEVVRGWALRADNSAYTSLSTVTWNKNGFTATGEAKESALAKRFSVACNTNPVTVTFGSETIAQKFLAETKIFNANAETTSDVVTGLVKDKTIFYPATGNLITVNYKEGEETKEVLPTFTLSEQEVAEKAPEVLTEVAKNGGKVVLPEGEEDVTLSSQLKVVADANVEIDLNGNKLKGDVSVEDGASLKIEGGTYEGGLSALAPKSGEGSQVTLEDVTAKNDGRFGIFVGPTDDAGSSVTTEIVVTITDSRLEGNIGLFVNGRMDGAIINITNSAILGNNGCGLSVCGKAEVDAKNSVFFGSATAVQMASGKGTFTDCTFVSANDNFGATEFGENTSIPTATLGNFVINSRGGGYDYPVNVTLAGANTKFITAKMDDGSKYTVKDILVGVPTETKNIALNWTSSDNITHLIGYYEVDETPAQKVTVTVVDANPSADSEVRVNLTNTTDNDLTLKVGTNVFVWTDNKTAEDDVAIEAVQAMVKGVEIAAKD